MTLRAIDGLRIDLTKDVNQGLDELEKRPELAVKGPFLKSKVGSLMRTFPLTRVVEWSYNGTVYRRRGPFKVLFTPELYIPCPGMKSGVLHLHTERFEQIWWFRKPPESRPPVYHDLEELEMRAMQRYTQRVKRRMDQWSYDVENAMDKFYTWKTRKLYNLDRAWARIRNKRPWTRELQKKIDDIEQKIKEVSAKQFVSHLPWSDEEYGEYQAKYLDFMTHKYAADRRRWLGSQLHPLYMLPVWHMKVSPGYAVATLDQSFKSGTVFDGHETSSSIRLSDWVDLSTQAPSGLFAKEIMYDEDKVLDAVNEMLPRSEMRHNLIVTAVELREIGNLFTEMRTILKELSKAVSLMARRGKDIFNLIKVYKNHWANFGQILKLRDYQIAKRGALLSISGCREAARCLSCHDLARKFGDPDSVRALEGLWTVFHSDLERVMKPLYTALARAGKYTSRHRTIVQESHLDEFELKPQYLFNTGDEDEDIEDLDDAFTRAPVGPLIRTVGTAKEQRVTLVTTDVLADTFGNQVGVDEATTRYIMDLVGLNFNPKAIWDLMRYTFVIDWFLDVGNILNDYCSVTNLRFLSTIHGGCISEKITWSTQLACRHHQSSDYDEEWRDSDDSYGYSCVTNDIGLLTKPSTVRVYRRNPIPVEVLQRGRLRFNWDDYLFKGIGASSLVTGVELLIQRIRH